MAVLQAVRMQHPLLALGQHTSMQYLSCGFQSLAEGQSLLLDQTLSELSPVNLEQH